MKAPQQKENTRARPQLETESQELVNQHNEQARAALNYSSKKPPTRQDPSHKQGRKQQTETTKEHGDLANRGGL